MVDARVQSKAPQASEAQSDCPADLVEIARIAGAHGVRGWVKIQPFSSDSSVLGSVKTWWLSPPSKTLSRVLSDLQSGENASSVSDASQISGVADAAHPVATSSAVAQRYNVVWSKEHGSTWLACLKGLVDRDQAHALKGSSVWVSRDAFPALQADEYYWIDLIGCQVFSVAVDGEDQGTPGVSDSPEGLPASNHALMPLGVVHSIEENPAHPLLSVLRQERTEAGDLVSIVNARGKPVHTLIPFVAAHVLSVDIQGKRIVVDWPADF